MHIRTRRLTRGDVAVRVVLLLLLAGCYMGLSPVASASVSPLPSEGTVTLRVGLIVDVDSLNPLLGNNVTSNLIRSLNYDVLVGVDPVTLKPRKGVDAGGLATDWTTSPDGTVWTFTLRRTASWQNGHGPVTARDVAFTYNYVIARWHEHLHREHRRHPQRGSDG